MPNLISPCLFSFNKLSFSHFPNIEAAPFFGMCADHPVLKIVNLRRNFITDEGGKSLARILVNSHIEELDASFNLYDKMGFSSLKIYDN